MILSYGSLALHSAAGDQKDIPVLKVAETSRGILVLWLKVGQRFLLSHVSCTLIGDTLYHFYTWKKTLELGAGRKETERCTLRLSAFMSSGLIKFNSSQKIQTMRLGQVSMKEAKFNCATKSLCQCKLRQLNNFWLTMTREI